MLRGKLSVIVDSATDIKDPSLQGKGNSYCTVRVGSQVFSTTVVKGGSSSPIFHAEFEFDIDGSTNDLAVSVYSRDIGRDDELIGYTTLKLKDIFSAKHRVPLSAVPLWVSLEKSAGFINISLTFNELGTGFTRSHIVDPLLDSLPHPHPLLDSLPHPLLWPKYPLLKEEVGSDEVGSAVGTSELGNGLDLEAVVSMPGPLSDFEPFPKRKRLDGPSQAKDLLETYIQCGEFEEFCNARNIHGEDKIDMGRGRLTAALFPGAFCRHLEALILASETSNAQDFPQYFKEASSLVLKDLPYAKTNLQNGEFQFIDEVRQGEPVSVDVVFRLGGLIAICQQSLPNSKTHIEYCIVQHNVTGVYLCRQAERIAFNEDSIMEEAIGVLGLETTCDDIHVENVRDDGSYYSGNLKDFSYKFVLPENGDLDRAMDNQCANKLFGHLKGAEFLAGEEYGLKCSPLLAIALAIATDRKNLALKWNLRHGHMDIENLSLVGFEYVKWEILYMDKINELGFAVEWGMEQLVACRASSSSLAQTKTSRALLPHHEEINPHEIQAYAAVFGNGVLQKRTLGGSLTLPGGIGVGGSVETFGSKGKDLAKEAHSRIMERLRRGSGQFVETKNLDAKHAYVKENLLQGRLSELPDNYLVVGDNVDHGYVSIYWADDEHGKYAWITDIMLPDGKGSLLKGRLLKGLRMEVKRDGSKLVTVDVSKSTPDLMSRFRRHKKLDIIENNMIPVPQGSHSHDQWVHLIGHQEKFFGNKFLWEATHMRAIVSSRTSYSSGALLEMYVLNDKFGDIGYCVRGETDAPLVHHCVTVVAWGQFSKAPASLVLGADLIKWGGLIDENDLC